MTYKYVHQDDKENCPLCESLIMEDQQCYAYDCPYGKLERMKTNEQ